MNKENFNFKDKFCLLLLNSYLIGQTLTATDGLSCGMYKHGLKDKFMSFYVLIQCFFN